MIDKIYVPFHTNKKRKRNYLNIRTEVSDNPIKNIKKMRLRCTDTTQAFTICSPYIVKFS